jgi:hypothetical protein
MHDVRGAFGVNDVQRYPLFAVAIKVELTWLRNGNVDALKDYSYAVVTPGRSLGPAITAIAHQYDCRVQFDLGRFFGETPGDAVEQLAQLAFVELRGHHAWDPSARRAPSRGAPAAPRAWRARPTRNAIEQALHGRDLLAFFDHSLRRFGGGCDRGRPGMMSTENSVCRGAAVRPLPNG